MLALFGDTKFMPKGSKDQNGDIGDYLLFLAPALPSVLDKFHTRSGMWLTEKVQVASKSRKQYGFLVRDEADEYLGFRTSFHLRRTDLYSCNFRFVLQNTSLGITSTGIASPNTLFLHFGWQSVLLNNQRVWVNDISLHQNDQKFPIANDSYEKLFDDVDNTSTLIFVEIEYTQEGNDFRVYLNNRRKPFLHKKLDLAKILDADANGDCYVGFISTGAGNRPRVDVGSWTWSTITKTDKRNKVELLTFPTISLFDYLDLIVEQKRKQPASSQQKLDLLGAVIDRTLTVYCLTDNLKDMSLACEYIPMHLNDFVDSLQDPDEENSDLNKSYIEPIIPYVEKIKKPIDLLNDKINSLSTSKLGKYQEWPVLIYNFNEIKYNYKEYKKAFQEAVERVPPKGTLREDFEKGVNNKLFSDCIFEVEDKTFVGHKILFQCRTPKFYEMYIKDNAEGIPIVIQNVSHVLFLEFLYYVYSNKLPSDVTVKQSLETLIQSWEDIDPIDIGSYFLYTRQLRSCLDLSNSKDIQFQVEDEILPAHKIILSLRNEFFKALLTSGMAESQQSQINLNDLQPATIRVLSEYIYSCSTNSMSPNDAVMLLCTASHIIDTRLKHICENIIQNGIDVDNVISLFEAASFYSAIHLQMFCRNFIVNNFATVLKTEDWKNLDSKLQEEIYVCLDPSAKAVFEQYKKILSLNIAPIDEVPRKQRKKKEKVVKEEKEPDTSKQCPICSKPSDLTCSRCHRVVYCSVAHQKQDWKQHKIKCQSSYARVFLQYIKQEVPTVLDLLH